MAATWMPGRPRVVSALFSSSSRPAKAPESTCSLAFLTAAACRRRGRATCPVAVLVLATSARRAQLLHRARRGLDDHGLLEFVLLLVVLDEAQLVMPDGDDVAVLQGMLLDQLAVDVGAVGAVQVLKERVVEDVDDQRVVAADRGIVDADVIVRQAPDRVALLVHVVFRHDLAIQAKYQPCHVLLPLSRVSRTSPGSCRNILSASRESVDDVRHDHRDVVPAAIVIGQLNQLLSDRIKISTKGVDG